jgi:hypothetical protein
VEFFIDSEMPRTTRVTGITIAFLISACGARSTTPPTTKDPVIVVDAAVPEPTPADAAAPISVITPSKPGTRVDSPHGGMITDLAVTPDGTAAVTSDDLGGHRLWPTLDGSQEPRAIELPAPAQIAIGHDPKGFLIVLIDDAGGLVLQRVDRDGLLLSRATLPLEPTYRGLAMTDRGPLAWRSDQRLVRLAADGTIEAQLATDPGQRLLSLAVPATNNADKAIAIIEGANDTKNWRRARWVSIGATLAWGSWLILGDDLEPNAAVSPNLTRLAVVTGAAGATTTRVYDLSASKSIGAETTFNALAIEVADDANIVWGGQNGQTTWLDFTQSPRRARPLQLSQVAGGGVLASGGGKIFSANGGEIVISTSTAVSYLGYAVQSPHVAAAGPNGQIAIASGEHAVLLDPKLRSQPMPLVPTGSSISLLRWLTGDEWAVQAVKLDTATQTLALVDLGKSQRFEWRTNQAVSQLAYDPSSRLLAASYGQQPEVARYLPGKLRVESLATYPKPGPYDRIQLWPVSPAVANGTQVVVSVSRDQATVRWVSDPKTLDKGTSMVIEGSIAAVDVTGRVYAWRNVSGKLELALLRDGKQVGTLAVDPGGRGVYPDPAGERVLIVGPQIVMLGPDGARVWARTLTGVTHALWLDDGAIALVSALGIVRVDAKTGDTQAKRCGWGFELSSKPHPARARVEPLCTQR